MKLVCTLFCFFLGFLARAEVIDRIVAIVNNETILESDFGDLKTKLKTPSMIDDSLLDNKDVEQLGKTRTTMLNYMINEKLLDSEIKKLNLSVTSDRVQQEIKEMAKRNNVTTDEILATIKQQGLTVAEYQDFLKTKIERQSLIESEIISKIKVTEEDALNEYLRRHPQSHTTVNEFTIAHIFFNPKKGGPEAAVERAQAALAKLRAGASFESAAEQYSEDPNFTSGGLLGTFKSGEFMPEIEEAILNLKPGELTGIVKSRQGYHIVRLVDKKLTSDPLFEKDKQKLMSELLETNFKRQLKIWLQYKRDEAFIRINAP